MTVYVKGGYGTVGEQSCLILLTLLLVIFNSLVGGDAVTEQRNVLFHYPVNTLAQSLCREVRRTANLNVQTRADGKAHCCLCLRPKLLDGEEEHELCGSCVDLCTCGIGVSDKTYNTARCGNRLSHSLGVGTYVLLTQGNVVKCEYITGNFCRNGIGRQLACYKTHFSNYVK